MTDYKPGDRVSLEHTETGQAMMNFTVEAIGSLSAIRSIWRTEPVYLNELPAGWLVTDHKPKIELPTEDGIYVDERGHPWERELGEWFLDGLYKDNEQVIECAPFTRLVPEGSEREAAIREVIAFYESMLHHDLQANYHGRARAQFGITE